jgi:hypothetical protein
VQHVDVEVEGVVLILSLALQPPLLQHDDSTKVGGGALSVSVFARLTSLPLPVPQQPFSQDGFSSSFRGSFVVMMMVYAYAFVQLALLVTTV